jgi:hypothetical protein
LALDTKPDAKRSEIKSHKVQIQLQLHGAPLLQNGLDENMAAAVLVLENSGRCTAAPVGTTASNEWNETTDLYARVAHGEGAARARLSVAQLVSRYETFFTARNSGEGVVIPVRVPAAPPFVP